MDFKTGFLILATSLFVVSSVFFGILAYNRLTDDGPECVVGRVWIAQGGGFISIGESVVCGEFHSKIYGPEIRPWTGPIQFYHDHE